MKPKAFPRHPQRFPVDVPARFREEGETTWTAGRLVNLSEGGLCLESDSPPEKGMELEIVTISKDKKDQVRRRLLRAKVVWCKGSRCGLQFVEAPEAKRRRTAAASKAGAKTAAQTMMKPTLKSEPKSAPNVSDPKRALETALKLVSKKKDK